MTESRLPLRVPGAGGHRSAEGQGCCELAAGTPAWLCSRALVSRRRGATVCCWRRGEREGQEVGPLRPGCGPWRRARAIKV